MAKKNTFFEAVKKALTIMLAASMIVSVSAAPGGGKPDNGNYVLDAKNYVGSRGFGWDTYTKNAKLLDENNVDVYSKITVTVGSTTLPKDSTRYADNADVAASGVTISGIPEGYYLSAYKITCDKYSCRTDQAGKATDEVVSLEAGQGSYHVTISKADMGHSNPSANNYWILIELKAFEVQEENTVTYPYEVLYNYGELTDALASAPATTDVITYNFGATATVLAPNAIAVAAATALGYEFIGWEIESVRGIRAVDTVIGTAMDPADPLYITGETTLKAVWNKLPEPPATYPVAYAFEGDVPTGSEAQALPVDGNTYAAGASVTVANGYEAFVGHKNGEIGTWSFNGWTLNGAPAGATATMAEGGLTFVGTWTFTAAKYYVIHYEVQGDKPVAYNGTIPSDTTAQATTAQTVAAGLTSTAKTNADGELGTWSFNGWTTSNAAVTDGAYTMPANDVTFIGTWTFKADGYNKITYEVQGEAPAAFEGTIPATATAQATTAQTVADALTTDATVNAAGELGTWSFNGWTTDDVAVADGAYTMPANDVAFVGTWSFTAAEYYGITYEVTGEAPAAFEGTIPAAATAQATTAQTVAGALTTDVTVNAAGELGTWIFNGWTTDDVAVADGAYTMPANDVAFVGTWTFTATEEEAYTISYEVIGNAPATFDGIIPAATTARANTAQTVAGALTTDVTTESGGVIGTWSFNGWTTDDVAVAGGAYTMPENDVKFVGTWSFAADEFYTISYVIVGGENPATFEGTIPADATAQAGTLQTVAAGLTTSETTKDVYVEGTWTFSGWVSYEVSAVNGMFTMPENDVVFVGSWAFAAAAPTFVEPEETLPTPEEPETEEPETEIPETEEPEIEIPEEDVPLEDLPEEEVPLADLPEEEVPLTDIPDEDVPLTGDTSLWFVLFGISAAALIGITVFEKKRKQEQE